MTLAAGGLHKNRGDTLARDACANPAPWGAMAAAMNMGTETGSGLKRWACVRTSSNAAYA